LCRSRQNFAQACGKNFYLIFVIRAYDFIFDVKNSGGTHQLFFADQGKKFAQACGKNIAEKKKKFFCQAIKFFCQAMFLDIAIFLAMSKNMRQKIFLSSNKIFLSSNVFQHSHFFGYVLRKWLCSCPLKFFCQARNFSVKQCFWT
jgi:hypothetical protein